MAFTGLEFFTDGPKRIVGTPLSNILRAFPAKPITDKARLGYSFRPIPCNSAVAYDPDVCVPGDIKMDPEGYAAAKHAEVDVLQSAFKCSTVGTTDQEIHDAAQGAIERNLWRAVDSKVTGMLAPLATPITGAPVPPDCALGNAAEYLAANSYWGTGVIVVPYIYLDLYGTQHVYKDGDLYRDTAGNLVIGSPSLNGIIYAFDSEVDVFTSDIQLLDEYAPGLTSVNDRVVRAEVVYTVAIDPCVVGSVAVTDCVS